MKPLFVTTDISDKLTQTQNTPSDLNAKIVAQMHAGVCHFFFLKKDGSIREAYGTLNKQLLESMLGPQEETQQSEPVPNSDATFQNYFDLTAEGEPKRKFRRYDIANLICMF